MSSSPFFEIVLAARTVELMETYRHMPLTIGRAVKRGLDLGMHDAITEISANRLTGEGPFPVEEHRLGVGKSTPQHRPGQLRQSVWASPAEIQSSGLVTSSVGSPVFYARIHEFGLIYSRTSKPGKVRLRTDRKGRLLRQEGTPLAIFARRSMKSVREVPYEGGRTYQVRVPARHPSVSVSPMPPPAIGRRIDAAIVEALDPTSLKP